MAEAATARVLRSAHDLADGGLAVALAECTFRNVAAGVGARVDLPAGLDPHVALFSESPSRMLVTTRDEAALAALATKHGVPSPAWARSAATGWSSPATDPISWTSPWPTCSRLGRASRKISRPADGRLRTEHNP